MNKLWIKAALVRAARTTAQAAAATLIAAGAVSVLDVDWKAVASVSLLSGIMSLITSIAGLPEVTIDQKPEQPFDIDEDDEEEEEEDDE